MANPRRTAAVGGCRRPRDDQRVHSLREWRPVPRRLVLRSQGDSQPRNGPLRLRGSIGGQSAAVPLAYRGSDHGHSHGRGRGRRLGRRRARDARVPEDPPGAEARDRGVSRTGFTSVAVSTLTDRSLGTSHCGRGWSWSSSAGVDRCPVGGGSRYGSIVPRGGRDPFIEEQRGVRTGVSGLGRTCWYQVGVTAVDRRRGMCRLLAPSSPPSRRWHGASCKAIAGGG